MRLASASNERATARTCGRDRGRGCGLLLLLCLAVEPRPGRAESSAEPPASSSAPGPAVAEPGPAPVVESPPASAVVPPSEPVEPPPSPLPRLELERPTGVDYNAPDPDRDLRTWGRALVSVGVANYLVWQYDWFVGEEWAYVARDDIRWNLENGFSFDGNKLPTNFLSHPYQGAAYFNVARASGLDFWESTPFVFLGSASWELFAETEPPSTNDLLATTLGGIVLGEILYRLSSDVLDDSSTGFERFMREMLATLLNPGRGIERMVDGTAFKGGPPPARRHLRRAALDVGADRILLVQDRGLTRYGPQPLVALQIEYGDLLPRADARPFEPFEAFDLYGALNLGSRIDALGAQVYAQGLLYGFSYDLGTDEGRDHRDNDVLGIVQSFDFRGAHIAQFGGMGIGPTNIVVLRFGPRRRVRIGTDVQWLAIGGSSSPVDGDSERGYNYLTGVTAGEEFRVELGDAGEFGFRAKQYAAVVIDGEPGEEFIGHVRAWYEIDLISGLGLGMAPSLVHRISDYDEAGEISLAQLEAQVYARGHF